MATTHNSVDLTKFGYTSTESITYTCLLDLGPSTGPAVARHLRIARTNAYDALRGLVAKHAAKRVGAEPAVFRAVDPPAMVARAAAEQARDLERLEAELLDRGSSGTPDTVPIGTEREFREVALRLAVRESGVVRALADAKLLVALAPLWHKRFSDAAPTELWVAGGEVPAGLPIQPVGTIERERLDRYFPRELAVLVTPNAAMLAHRVDGILRGFWSSEPLSLGSARAAMTALVNPERD